MTLQVHDELLFDVPEDEVDSVRTLVRHEMENVIELKVPIVADVGVGQNWRDLKGKWFQKSVVIRSRSNISGFGKCGVLLQLTCRPARSPQTHSLCSEEMSSRTIVYCCRCTQPALRCESPGELIFGMSTDALLRMMPVSPPPLLPPMLTSSVSTV